MDKKDKMRIAFRAKGIHRKTIIKLIKEEKKRINKTK